MLTVPNTDMPYLKQVYKNSWNVARTKHDYDGDENGGNAFLPPVSASLASPGPQTRL